MHPAPIPDSQPSHVLPAWFADAVDGGRPYPDATAQISLAIELAHQNVEHASGGPFGAAVFDHHGGLIAAGVDRVEQIGSSLAHAKIVALVGAESRLGRARLNTDGNSHTLATSAQACCQCYGATMWAGIDFLLIAARAEDVESLTGV